MLLHEDEVDGRYQTGEGGEVVPGQMLLKGDDGEEREDRQGDDLLNDLELNEREGTAVALEADSVFIQTDVAMTVDKARVHLQTCRIDDLAAFRNRKMFPDRREFSVVN